MTLTNRIKRIAGLEGLTKGEIGLTLLFLVVFVPLIYKLIVPIFIVFGLSEFTIIINGTIFIIGLMLGWKLFWRNFKIIDILAYILVSFFLYVSPIFYSSSNSFVDENILPFISGVLPCYFVGLSLNHPKRDQMLLFVAKMGIIVQLFWQACFLLGFVEREETVYDDTLGEQMEAAYSLVFPVLTMICGCANKHSLENILFLVIGIALLFFMGTRGPIVIFLAFVAVYYLFFRSFKKFNILIKSVIISISALLYYFIVPICMLIAPFVASLGFSPRVFESFVGNAMVSSDATSDRDAFYDRVFGAIINDPTGFGYGWGGDRMFTPNGGYAHNLELELLCQFGMVWGGAILLFLFYLMLRSFLICKNRDDKNFWLVMVCTGFLSLQLSESYVTYPLFFVFLGGIVSLIRTNCVRDHLKNQLAK